MASSACLSRPVGETEVMTARVLPPYNLRHHAQFSSRHESGDLTGSGLYVSQPSQVTVRSFPSSRVLWTRIECADFILTGLTEVEYGGDGSGHDGGRVARTVLRRLVLRNALWRNGRVGLVDRPRGEVPSATVSLLAAGYSSA